MKFIANSLADLPIVSKQLVDLVKPSPICLFYGEMGSGKTSLIKQICKDLNVVDQVSSPTFSLVNEYRTKDNDSIYHFDFYRLNEINEALEIGLYDYLDSGSYCFIEWPQRISSLLDGHLSKINISIDLDTQARIIEVNV